MRSSVKLSLTLAVVATTLITTACGTIRDRSRDYLQVEEMEPIVVPEHLSAERLGEIYPIPPISDTVVPEGDGDVPRPQSLARNVFEEEVRIQTLGDDSWILINRPTAEIWPRVRSLLNRSGIPVVAADAPSGVMETGWLTFRDDDVLSHRFQLQLTPGVQTNSSEIKVRQQQVAQGQEERVRDWLAGSGDRNREMDMLRIVAESLAGDDSASSVSLLAQEIGGKPRVTIQTPRVADPYLSMELVFLRAWASLSYSLERGGFSIDEQRQGDDSGVFHVGFLPPADSEPGFFSRIFRRGSVDNRVSYQVLVSPNGSGVAVRLTGPEGQNLPREEALRLLRIIQSNLT